MKEVEQKAIEYVIEKVFFHYSYKDSFYQSLFNNDLDTAYDYFLNRCRALNFQAEGILFKAFEEYAEIHYEEYYFVTRFEKLFDVLVMKVKKFKNAYVNYHLVEFSETGQDKEDYLDILDGDVNESKKGLSALDIAGSVFGDYNEIYVEVNINFLQCKLETFIIGKYVKEEEKLSCDSIDDLIEILEKCSHEDLTFVDFIDMDELLEEEQQKRKVGYGFEATDDEIQRLNDVLVEYYQKTFGDTISEANYHLGNLRTVTNVPVYHTETNDGQPVDVTLELHDMRLVAEKPNDTDDYKFNNVEEIIEYFSGLCGDSFTTLDEYDLDMI